MGRHWYDDGKMMKKKNTFFDFIDCGNWLCDNKYTAHNKLAIMGGSAGGLLVGATLNLADPGFWDLGLDIIERRLEATIEALRTQVPPPDIILIADDGSNDDTPDILARVYGFTAPALGDTAISSTVANLHWLRLPRGGKAVALNTAIAASIATKMAPRLRANDGAVVHAQT